MFRIVRASIQRAVRTTPQSVTAVPAMAVRSLSNFHPIAMVSHYHVAYVFFITNLPKLTCVFAPGMLLSIGILRITRSKLSSTSLRIITKGYAAQALPISEAQTYPLFPLYYFFDRFNKSWLDIPRTMPRQASFHYLTLLSDKMADGFLWLPWIRLPKFWMSHL